MAALSSPVADPRDRGGRAQPLLIVDALRKHFPVRGGLLNRRTATVQAVDPWGAFTLSGSGFLPGERVTAHLHGSDAVLGSATVGQPGRLAAARPQNLGADGPDRLAGSQRVLGRG